MRNIFLPTADRSVLCKAAVLAVAGAIAAGCFGIFHDQITYSISPEYFTRMKFDQFRSADFGLPPRVFVAVIGFLGTWWVGLITVWFLARIALAKFSSPEKRVAVAMIIIIGITILSGIAGYFGGPSMLENRSGWRDALNSLGVLDTTAFYRAAGIHLASYAGALLGWIVMMARFLTATRHGSPGLQSVPPLPKPDGPIPPREC